MNFIEHIDYYNSTSDYPLHRHAACEMIYVKNGSIKMYYGDSFVTAGENTLVFVPSSLAHKTVVSKDVYERILVFFNAASFSKIVQSDLFSSLTTGLNVRRVLTANDNFGGQKLIEEMYSHLHSPQLVSEEIFISDLSKLLVNIIKQNAQLFQQSSITSRVISDTIHYITANCCTNLKVTDLARRVHLSECYFSHLFKAETGMSPRGFISLMRLSTAHSLLYDNSLSVAEVSEKCCFTSPSDMTRKFREEYNITPTQMRKEISQRNATD